METAAELALRLVREWPLNSIGKIDRKALCELLSRAAAPASGAHP